MFNITKQDFQLTGAILAVPVPHHAEALETPPGALVASTNPLDADVVALLQHVVGTWSAGSVELCAG